MENTKAVFKREFRAYFASPIAYIFLCVFIVFNNWMFFRVFFLRDIASMREYFGLLPCVFLFDHPAVTMRTWSEERKMGTIEMLLTLPVKDLEAVLGKYLAGLAFILTAFVFTFTVPVSVELAGDPEWGVMLAGYIGAVFLGGAYLAIGMFISSVTENQIVAFIIGVMVTFFLFIIGEDFVTAFAPSFFVPFLEYVGLGRHFNSITRGVVDSSDVIYYLSVIVFFVYLNIKSVESRRWK